MHLRQYEVQALLRISLVVEDVLSSHVIQLEKLDANSIAVGDHEFTLTPLLMTLDLGEEILQRVDEGLELLGSSITHRAKGMNASAEHWEHPH